jgi:uroporphyrinogen decarboxylase
MTDPQWQQLLRVLRGELLDPLPVGFIIDSPWLAPWAGVPVMDYFSHDATWLDLNLRAVRQFPEVLFFPGFWAEYAMCTEPSAFGAKCIWPENDFPFAARMLADYSEIARLKKPNCRTDGMGPFVIKRLEHARPAIEQAGHAIRFATSRGPMNIATYLLGHTETFLGVKTQPEEIHRLLEVVTDYIVDWVRYQQAKFDTIDGLLILDDLIGFLGDADFRAFALPYFQRIYAAIDVRVKFLHNDCHGLVTARHLAAMGVNLFNFSFEHGMNQMRQACGEGVVLLGNIPPRDVLARGTPADVRRSVAEMRSSITDKRRVILSCGGGTPPGVSTANLEAFCEAAVLS